VSVNLYEFILAAVLYIYDLEQGWRTRGPQKNFVRPAKHSGEASSYYFRLLFVSVDEQFFSFW